LHNTPAQLLGEFGLLGFAIYLAFLGCLGYLALRLIKHLEPGKEKWLLWGVLISLAGYATSSLTDYQVENIPIAVVLVLNFAFIICIAQLNQLVPFVQMPRLSENLRRGLSLAIFAFIGISLVIWIPVNIANYAGVMAKRAFSADQIIKADNYWNAGSHFQNWDPVFNIIAGNHLIKLSEIVPPEDQKNLQEQAVNYFTKAIDAAPNDSILNFLLAAQFLETDPSQAEVYASRSVQLVPRLNYYSFHVLGMAYLAQGKVDKATSAFAIDAIAFPKSIGLANWQGPPLRELQHEVIAKAELLHDELLKKADLSSVDGQELYEQSLVFRWWNGLPLPDYNPELLRPVVRALILAQDSPAEALKIVDEAIAVNPDEVNRGLALLKLWLQPEILLNKKEAEKFGLTGEGIIEVREHLAQNQSPYNGP
jgi:tetratricopeptide (TPR) repeat protein